MENKADNQRIVVEVPSNKDNFSLLSPTPQQSQIEKFRLGWINAIALPDNLADLIFDITALITIPALVSSCWASFPLPSFIRFGVLSAVLIGVLVLWQISAIPEVKGVLVFRVLLIGVGVILGS